MHYNSIINKCKCYNDATHMLPLVCVKMKDLIRSWYPLFAHEAVFTDEWWQQNNDQASLHITKACIHMNMQCFCMSWLGCRFKICFNLRMGILYTHPESLQSLVSLDWKDPSSPNYLLLLGHSPQASFHLLMSLDWNELASSPLSIHYRLFRDVGHCSPPNHLFTIR